MMLPIVLTDQAVAEFDAAADWYQREARLGTRFTSNVREAFERIRQMPTLHAVVHRSLRRAKVRKFPYNIFYRILPDRVEVVAVLHGRRDPSIWQSRG